MTWSRLALGLLVVSLPVSSALAQYSFDPDNADEKGYGVKYFGSAKDDQGALLTGVVIAIGTDVILLTDEQGRYRGNVDPSDAADNTPVTCRRLGYSFVRMTRRKGLPGGVKQTIEADCVLHKNK